MTDEDVQKALTDYMIVRACRADPSTKTLTLRTAGRVAISVGSPLRGMSREMVFVKSGLALGLISPTNDPVRRLEEGATTINIIGLEGENHGVGTPEDSDLATAQLR